MYGLAIRSPFPACVAILVSVVVTSDADADANWPVQVTSIGPRPILVEVSAGVVAPCDSPDDVLLYRGPLLPEHGASRELAEPERLLPADVRQLPRGQLVALEVPAASEDLP